MSDVVEPIPSRMIPQRYPLWVCWYSTGPESAAAGASPYIRVAPVIGWELEDIDLGVPEALTPDGPVPADNATADGVTWHVEFHETRATAFAAASTVLDRCADTSTVTPAVDDRQMFAFAAEHFDRMDGTPDA